MEDILETHCKLVDYSKNLLLNAVNDEQEEHARKILELARKQEEFLYIN